MQPQNRYPDAIMPKKAMSGDESPWHSLFYCFLLGVVEQVTDRSQSDRKKGQSDG